jgi:hypothetical protein
MARASLLLASVTCALAVAACSEAITVEIVNNTGQPITVSSCLGEVALQPGGWHTLELYSCAESPTVRVQSGSQTWVYGSFLSFGAPFLRRELRRQRIRMGIFYRAQIEPAGSVVFVPRGVALPVAEPHKVSGAVSISPT